MGNLGKYLILLGAVGMSGLASIAEDAQASTNSDELYSESIYIERSSAEIPTALESNARPKGKVDAVDRPTGRAIESLSELDSVDNGKKVSQRDDD